MGEAKRRKQLDSNYGKVPDLTSSNQKQKHVDLIMGKLSTEFAEELKQIAAAETLIQPYADYRETVAAWLNQQLASYQPSERLLIASSIMTCYAEIAIKQEASPLLIKFWFDVLKSDLPEEKRQRIQGIAQQIEAELTATSSES